MFERRQYQHDAADYAMDSTGRPILCAPTASGKSFMAALIAQRTVAEGERFGFLTPRLELVGQAAHTMSEVCGIEQVGVLQAGQDYWDRSRDVQVISSSTLLARTKRAHTWFPDVDRLVVDEAHLSVAPQMMKRVLGYYADRAKILGMTATPGRKSGLGLGSFYSHIHHVTTVQQLLQDGYLCPLEYWGGKQADLTRVRRRRDYHTGDLSKVSTPLVGDVIDNWGRLASDLHTLVFAIDVPHAEALTRRFREVGIKAAAMHVAMTPYRRKRNFEAFRDREIQVLVNIAMMSYGADIPCLECLVCVRPTKSHVLWLQMLGRLMRTYPGKSFGLVIDHTPNTRELGYAHDLFRWRLDEKRDAVVNTTRQSVGGKGPKKPKPHQCLSCDFIFESSLVCPKCGTEKPLPKRDLPTLEADLVRISEQRATKQQEDWPDDETFYLMLRFYGAKKKYKPGWAHLKYMERVGKRPPREWDDRKPIEPSIRVKNWCAAQGRKYARERKKREQAAA